LIFSKNSSSIVFDEARPGLLNLLNIYKGISGKDNHAIEEEFLDKSYKEFKEILSESLIDFLSPIQKKYFHYLDDRIELKKLMVMGRQKTMAVAEKKVKEVKEKVGFVL
jgi:tryptophanyl-tRNA synthetase